MLEKALADGSDLANCPQDFLPVNLAQGLLRHKTPTPARGAIFAQTQDWLQTLGFYCKLHRLGLGDEATDNLYARIGSSKPVLAFCGHLDTVPEGEELLWSSPPYEGLIKDGLLVGRGSVDMKSSVAAFIAATQRYLAHKGRVKNAQPNGSIVFLLTGDEEGRATFGTKALLEALRDEEKDFDACLTGEPTCAEVLGDRIKIGRRGSLSLQIEVRGKAGHSAYPQYARNAAHILLALLNELAGINLDSIASNKETSCATFEPSNLQISGFSTDTFVSNMLPGKAQAVISIRYNTKHDESSLLALLEEKSRKFERDGSQITIERLSGARAFYTHPNRFVALVADAISEVTGVTPQLSTEGGTSDSRFIHHLCPTLDFGPVGTQMHAIDESIQVSELSSLSDIYHTILLKFFSDKS